MKLMKLKDITLFYSNVPEDEYPLWVSDTTYNTGDRVIVTTEVDGTTERIPHEIYESLIDSNTGNYPPDNPDKWGLIGATNRWKMFDQYANTQTENVETIEVVVDFSFCNAFALFDLYATEVEWYLYNGDYTVPEKFIKSEVIDLIFPVSDWYEYFYSEFEFKNDIYVNNVPIYSMGQLKLIIKNPGDTAKCGLLAIGREQNLGLSQFGATVTILDYSRKQTDDFGNIYLQQGKYAKKVDCEFWLETGRVDVVRKLLANVRAKPAIYNVNNVVLQNKMFESLIVYGFYRNFDIIISGPVYSKCSVEIEGII